MANVFLSYRRADTEDNAGRIYDWLVSAFGAGSVFKDIYSIHAGEDFRRALEETLSRCDVLLAIVGDRWLGVTSASGVRRLDEEGDYVRLEIQEALKRGIAVVPVLVNGASMPGPEELPEVLRPLAYRQAAVVRRDPDFRRDMGQLITELERLVPTIRTEARPRVLTTYLAALGEYLRGALSSQPPYFPLEFIPRSEFARDLLADDPGVSLNQIVERNPRSAIIGSPGSGKSRALLELAAQYCRAAQESSASAPAAKLFMPVYAPLRNYRQTGGGDAQAWHETLLGILNYTLSQHGHEFGSKAELVEFLRTHRPLLLLDGLNEMKGESSAELLDSLRTIGIDARIVVSSRAREYPSERVDYPVYQVKGLDYPDDVTAFVTGVQPHFGLTHAGVFAIFDRCESDTGIRRLASNPFILCQMCRAESKGFLSQARHIFDIYRSICEAMVHDEGTLNPQAAHACLAHVASWIHEREQLSIGASEVAAAFAKLGHSAAAIQEMLRGLIRARLLLQFPSPRTTRGASDYMLQFSHQIFQEFYVANQIIDHEIRPCLATESAARGIKKALSRHVGDPWYGEPIALAVLRLSDLSNETFLRTLRCLSREYQHLASLIFSIFPGHEAEASEIDSIRLGLLRRLKRRIDVWVFGIPFSYAWLPAAGLAAGVLVLWKLARWANLPLSGPSPAIAFGVGLSVALPSLYFRLLRLVYAHLDSVIFDQIVRQCVTSLDVLRWQGGEEVLVALRANAQANPYLGDRMRNWLCSAAVVKFSRIETLFHTFSGPERRELISLLGKQNNDSAIDMLFRLFGHAQASQADQKSILFALDETLRNLSRDDPLCLTIMDHVRASLPLAKAAAVRDNMLRLLSDRPLRRRIGEWDGLSRILERLWPILACSALLLLGCAFGVAWPHAEWPKIWILGSTIGCVVSFLGLAVKGYR